MRCYCCDADGTVPAFGTDLCPTCIEVIQDTLGYEKEDGEVEYETEGEVND